MEGIDHIADGVEVGGGDVGCAIGSEYEVVAGFSNREVGGSVGGAEDGEAVVSGAHTIDIELTRLVGSEVAISFGTDLCHVGVVGVEVIDGNGNGSLVVSTRVEDVGIPSERGLEVLRNHVVCTNFIEVLGETELVVEGFHNLNVVDHPPVGTAIALVASPTDTKLEAGHVGASGGEVSAEGAAEVGVHVNINSTYVDFHIVPATAGVVVDVAVVAVEFAIVLVHLEDYEGGTRCSESGELDVSVIVGIQAVTAPTLVTVDHGHKHETVVRGSGFEHIGEGVGSSDAIEEIAKEYGITALGALQTCESV